jgi:diguanylate cyclase (GGDEF)-like protein
LTWTDGVYDLFECGRGSTVERAAIVNLYHDESRAEMERLRANAIAVGGGFTLDAKIRTVRGVDRWMRLTAQVERVNGQPVRLFGAKQDITRDKMMWDHWRQMAERDHLTGLANRGLFQERFHGAPRPDSVLPPVAALVLVDLDRFKQVNDRYGHIAGDACLRAFAIRLQAAFRDALLVARIGGDEFAVLLGTAYTLAARLKRIARVINQPVPFQDHSLDIGASMGAAIVGRPHAHDPQRLFAQADTMLYAAKAAGSRQVKLFGAEGDSSPVSLSAFAERAGTRRYG